MQYMISDSNPTTQQVAENILISPNNKILSTCGEVTYQLIESPNGKVAALTILELKSSSSGLISVKTNNSLTVGTHNVVLN